MADQILDLRGVISPVTLLKISQTFREMRPDQTLEIWCGDQDTLCDVCKILPPSSYEVLLEEEMRTESAYRFQMRKKPTL
jgi:TusA-related sulfurtransferase